MYWFFLLIIFMKTLAVLVGPQGAGNHLWSKIFSLHEDVYGWKSLLDNYWEAHRTAEPFARYWRTPEDIKQFDWNLSDYFFTSISIPIGIKSAGTKWIPDLADFMHHAGRRGVNLKLIVCGRDQNILKHQQERLRGEHTLRHFMDQLPLIKNPTFVSYELLYLYRQEYLKTLDIGIPIAWYDPRVSDILAEDANAKYIKYVESNPLDNCNKTAKAIKHRP